MPFKNLAVPADFFFGSYSETNLGTENSFFLGFLGGSLVFSGSLGCGEGGELSGAGDDGDGLRRDWVGDGSGLGRG
jgi:hypothetical protein